MSQIDGDGEGFTIKQVLQEITGSEKTKASLNDSNYATDAKTCLLRNISKKEKASSKSS